MARVVFGASFLIVVANAPGLPRGPVPPLPEFAERLRYDSFDEAYRNGMTNAEVVLNGYTFAESWSGYALRRSGAVVPFLLRAVDSNGRTNLSCHTGAIRFWFKPEWTSVSLPGGTGPGANALLAELAAAGGGQSVGIWSLEVNSDGSALSLVAQSDGGSVQLLSAQISWQCGQWYLITLDYDPAGTALLFGDQWAAQSANSIVIPPTAGVLTLGSTVTGASPAGGDFEEFRSFGRPLDPADLTLYYNASSRHAAQGPLTQAEIDAWEQALETALAARQLNALASPMRPDGPFGPLDDSGGCVTGGPVYLTNFFVSEITTQCCAVTMTVAGGTNGIAYSLYMATNLVADLTNATWGWV